MNTFYEIFHTLERLNSMKPQSRRKYLQKIIRDKLEEQRNMMEHENKLKELERKSLFFSSVYCLEEVTKIK